ncbi:MAG: SufD family Fe-S cluster assembly protein [Beijerinckiaceae bacterium]|nr:MAG: SufD family Fe-S cluster assembly protein [Beijerinckiaceae bacterium]
MTAQIIPSKTSAEVALAEAFGTARAKLPGNAEVAQLREASFESFSKAGLPHRRIESWHYTDLRALMREALPLAQPPGAEAIAALGKEMRAAGLPAQSLVLVDGVFIPELSAKLPEGVRVSSLAAALAEGRRDVVTALSAEWAGVKDPIVSLNAALMQDGVVIDIAPGTKLDAPIRLVYASVSATPVAHFSRSLVLVGTGASVQISETSFGSGGRKGQINNALVIVGGDECDIAHTLSLTDTEPGSLRLESFMVKLGAKAHFDSFALITGGGIVRRQIFLRFDGADTKANLRGVSLLRGREHADTTLFVEHCAPGCEGRENFRYILDDEAVGVFQGRIHVAPAAQKTDSKMLCKALLLTDKVAMNSKPELEIFADDVVCGHGATCGGLNEDQIFYLQTRGLTFAQAEALLLDAFGGELVDELPDESLVAAFRAEIAAWLAKRPQGARL